MILSSQNIEELFECENGVRTLTSTEMTPVISEIKSLIESVFFQNWAEIPQATSLTKLYRIAQQSKVGSCKDRCCDFALLPSEKKAKLKHFCVVSVVQKKLDCMPQAHCGQPSWSPPSRIT